MILQVLSNYRLSCLVHFIVFKTSGERITTQEAERLLEPYGHIASVKDVNLDIQQRLAIPQSKLVSYEKYDSKRDVIKVRFIDNLHENTNV